MIIDRLLTCWFEGQEMSPNGIGQSFEFNNPKILEKKMHQFPRNEMNTPSNFSGRRDPEFYDAKFKVDQIQEKTDRMYRALNNLGKSIHGMHLAFQETTDCISSLYTHDHEHGNIARQYTEIRGYLDNTLASKMTQMFDSLIVEHAENVNLKFWKLQDRFRQHVEMEERFFHYDNKLQGLHSNKNNSKSDKEKLERNSRKLDIARYEYEDSKKALSQDMRDVLQKKDDLLDPLFVKLMQYQLQLQKETGAALDRMSPCSASLSDNVKARGLRLSTPSRPEGVPEGDLTAGTGEEDGILSKIGRNLGGVLPTALGGGAGSNNAAGRSDPSPTRSGGSRSPAFPRPSTSGMSMGSGKRMEGMGSNNNTSFSGGNNSGRYSNSSPTPSSASSSAFPSPADTSSFDRGAGGRDYEGSRWDAGGGGAGSAGYGGAGNGAAGGRGQQAAAKLDAGVRNVSSAFSRMKGRLSGHGRLDDGDGDDDFSHREQQDYHRGRGMGGGGQDRWDDYPAPSRPPALSRDDSFGAQQQRRGSGRGAEAFSTLRRTSSDPDFSSDAAENQRVASGSNLAPAPPVAEVGGFNDGAWGASPSTAAAFPANSFGGSAAATGPASDPFDNFTGSSAFSGANNNGGNNSAAWNQQQQQPPQMQQFTSDPFAGM